VGLWDRLRHALGTIWADWQSPTDDAHTRLLSGLATAWRAEQCAARKIRRLIPAIPYAQFRQRLDAMVRDDEQHASLVHERLTSLGGVLGEALNSLPKPESNVRGGSWQRLQQVLAVKRGLYEHYRQAASGVDDLGVQSILARLRDDEARHQEEIITMLMQLDAYVHESSD
jgi:rubrerythrin